MDDVYNTTDDYNPKRTRKILIVFDIEANEKFQSMDEELFIRCRKLNKSLVFITQYNFLVAKDVTLKNSTHYLIMKIHNKRELLSIAINHSADIDHKDFVNIYINFTRKPYYVLKIDTTLPANNSCVLEKIS